MRAEAGLAMAAILIPAAIGHAGGEAPVSVGTGEEVELCLAPEDARLADYIEGRRNAVLALYAVTGESGPLAVTADTGEETVIGLFPGGPFTAASVAEARRFFLPGSPETRCWTVELAGDGSAEVTLEISDLLE